MFLSLPFVAVRSPFPAILAAILATALPVVGLACGGADAPSSLAEPAATSRPAGDPTSAPTPPPDPAALLTETAANARAMESMRFAVTHETGSIYISAAAAKAMEAKGAWNETQGAEIAIDAYLVPGPDAAPESGTYVQLNMLVTSDAYFITDPLSGAWTKRPLDNLPVPVDQVADIMGGMLDAVEYPELAGLDTVDGRQSYRITGKVPASVMEWMLLAGLEGQYVDIAIWTDTERKLLRKIRMTGPIGAFDTPDTVRVLTVTDINDSVSIEPPTDFLDLTNLQ